MTNLCSQALGLVTLLHVTHFICQMLFSDSKFFSSHKMIPLVYTMQPIDQEVCYLPDVNIYSNFVLQSPQKGIQRVLNILMLLDLRRECICVI